MWKYDRGSTISDKCPSCDAPDEDIDFVSEDYDEDIYILYCKCSKCNISFHIIYHAVSVVEDKNVEV